MLAKFAVGLALFVCMPWLSRVARLPAVVGLLLSGIAIGPHGLDVIGSSRPVVDFLAELGKLLLMFCAGLEIDLALFRRARNRVMIFGLFTTLLPLLLGAAVGLVFGYPPVAAIVIGSLLASHTLLASPIVARLGVIRLEPVTVTFGATVISDLLSLVVFAICVSIFQSGFSLRDIAVQFLEIAIFIPLILVGLSRGGAFLLSKLADDEHASFALILAVMAVAAVLANVIRLPGIVGAFLAGLAVNAAVHHKPAKEKLTFLADALFIPTFFVTTGFLIKPGEFVRSIVHTPVFIFAVIAALFIGKWMAVQFAGRSFNYSSAARMTMWSLTLPQVAATLAATLVAFNTFDPAHHRLLDAQLLNVVLVVMLITSILGPLLTERFAPRLASDGCD